MDLSPKTTVTSAEDDKRWLASKHGTDSLETITLDLAGGSFDDVIVPDTYRAGIAHIPSGTPVAKDGDLYVLATPFDAVPDPDTEAVCDGHLFESVEFRTDSDTCGASLFWHGVVNSEFVPVTGFDGSTDGAEFIRYRG